MSVDLNQEQLYTGIEQPRINIVCIFMTALDLKERLRLWCKVKEFSPKSNRYCVIITCVDEQLRPGD
jgi:hypothetical protein